MCKCKCLKGFKNKTYLSKQNVDGSILENQVAVIKIKTTKLLLKSK